MRQVQRVPQDPQDRLAAWVPLGQQVRPERQVRPEQQEKLDQQDPLVQLGMMVFSVRPVQLAVLVLLELVEMVQLDRLAIWGQQDRLEKMVRQVRLVLQELLVQRER